MSTFGEFYVPSATGNVVDLTACRARQKLQEMGAVDQQGNFYVDQPFDPDWVAKFKRSAFYLVGGEVEVDIRSVDF
jgi:hypothetical protein